MLQLRDVTTGYGSHVVARHLTATLPSGQLVSILGPNGVGKSTLLRTLAALQPPLAGQIHLGQTPLHSLSSQALSRHLSIVLTQPSVPPHTTVAALVAFGRSPYTNFWGHLTPQDRDIVRQAMQQTGIQSLAQRTVDTLSDGERQKAMIAKAVAQQTPLILLDEPTAYLDFPSKVETMRMLRQLAHQQHKAILLTTHDIQMALQLSDHIWLVSPDGIVSGTPLQLAADGTLTRFLDHEGVTFSPDDLTLHIRP